MYVLHALWLPIVVSAVFVFILSWALHMLVPWHRADVRSLSNEDQLLETFRTLNVPTGDYMLPKPANPQQLKSPDFRAKLDRGPVVIMTVADGGFNMGRSLALWFLYILMVSYLSAYVAAHAIALSTFHYRPTRFAAITAFLAYSGALWQMSIWYRRSWGTTLRSTIDGILYAIVTGATLAWLWPR